MKTLTNTQKQELATRLKAYREFRGTALGKEWLQERAKQKAFVQSLLSGDKIGFLTEPQLKEIIKRLWATLFWGNKDYKATNVLERNTTVNKTGLETIRNELAELLYGTGEFTKRYDAFRKRVKGLGTSSVTEILHFAAPTKFCLWNDKPQTVLPRLGLTDLLPKRVFKNPNAMTGADYAECCAVVGLLRDEMIANGISPADFTDADCFLWYLFGQFADNPPPISPPPPPPLPSLTSGHSDIQAMLVKLGNLLEYDTYVADPSQVSEGQKLGDLATLKQLPQFTYASIVDTARYIDVIWFCDEFPSVL